MLKQLGVARVTAQNKNFAVTVETCRDPFWIPRDEKTEHFGISTGELLHDVHKHQKPLPLPKNDARKMGNVWMDIWPQ